MGSETSKVAEALVKAQDRIAELQSIVNNFDAFMAALAAIGPHAGKPDSHIEALLDKVKRVGELEATERELREAVKVLAEEVSAWSTGNFVTHQCQLPNGGECTGCKASERRQRATDAARANQIAAEAVREAGR